MHVIFGNFGNETIALMQFAKESQLSNVFVVSIDTGFQSDSFQSRVDEAEKLSTHYVFHWVRLSSNPDFSTLIRTRKQFPSKQFQWCVSFLKGMPINAWLDEQDPHKEALILSGKRKAKSKLFKDLTEFEHDSEYYDGRTIWHPLLEKDDVLFSELVSRTGLTWLEHRSLECDPCIHATHQDVLNLTKNSINRLNTLENEIGNSFFSIPIESFIEKIKNNSTQKETSFYLGCGSPYACGE